MMTKVREHSFSLSAPKIPLFENFPDLLLSTNSDGFILSANLQLTPILGFKVEDLLGTRLDPAFFEKIKKDLRFECKLRTQAGTLVPVEVRVLLQEGSFLLVVRDLRDAYPMNEFANNILQKIRNTLSVLGAQHYFMKHNADRLDTQKFLDGLDIIQKASSKMESFTKELQVPKEEFFRLI